MLIINQVPLFFTRIYSNNFFFFFFFSFLNHGSVFICGCSNKLCSVWLFQVYLRSDFKYRIAFIVNAIPPEGPEISHGFWTCPLCTRLFESLIIVWVVDAKSSASLQFILRNLIRYMFYKNFGYYWKERFSVSLPLAEEWM